jgi:hypothetical protein
MLLYVVKQAIKKDLNLAKAIKHLIKKKQITMFINKA